MKAIAPSESIARELAAQERLLPFLLNPHSYPHRPKRVRLLQTHASFVFLVPPFVYKVKKPVNFGFLNFSTLEKRRHFCERELALNRRLSPDMYLGVVPISVRGGRYAFGEGDEVVEYAVKMRKLPDGHFLDGLIAHGAVGPAEIQRIAVALTAFYRAQQPTEEIEAWGRIGRLKISTDENFRQAEPFVGQTLSPSAFATIRAFTNGCYSRHARLFSARVRERRIRDCHGDLHLEHIHLTPRALHIYDCIEFNDRFRYVDVASDVAFLAMDLDDKGRPDLARLFVAKLAAGLRDPGMLRLMDFYKCYRAYVRGKVESLHSVAHAAAETERAASAERARSYFRLALRYAVAGSRPLVVVVMGRIASGKSSLAAALAAELGWDAVSSDRVRKELAGFPLYERTSEAARARLYSSAMTARTYARLFAAAEAAARSGRGIVLDATFATRVHREQMRARFARRGLDWCVLEAHADDRTVRRRLREREARPEEISDARLDDFNALTQLYEPPTELPKSRCVKVRTTVPPEATLTAALTALARRQLGEPPPREGGVLGSK